MSITDHLLRFFLSRFIKRGSIQFTTASGSKVTCGDGSGEPASARFLTTAAEYRVLLEPELALGEVFMNGTFIVERGSIAQILPIVLDQPAILPLWAKVQWWLRYMSRVCTENPIRV